MMLFLKICFFFAIHLTKGLRIDLNKLGLTSIPTLPSETQALHLSHNSITEVTERDQRNTSRLEELYLNDNNLTTFPNVTTSVNYLQKLNLDKNNILEVSATNFLPFRNLKYLSLCFNRLREFLSDAGPPVFENLKKLYLTGNNISTLNETSFKGCKKLSILVIANNEIDRFPDLRSCGQTLDTLLLQDNLIHEIDGKLFQHYTNLKVLNVADNYLKLFPNMTFLGDTLEIFDFEQNPFDMDSFDFNLLSMLDKVNPFRFSKLDLIKVPALGSLCYGLSKLEITDNLIESVEQGVFQTCDELEVLYLTSNMIESFPNISEVGDTLTNLCLESNYIHSICNDNLVPLVKLNELDLDNNEFTVFPNLTGIAKTLQILSIKDNLIATIEAAKLDILDALDELDIGWNLITSFPDTLYLSAYDLSLSGNPLKSIPYFPNYASRISILYMQSCNFSHSSPDAFQNYSLLRTLKMDEVIFNDFPVLRYPVTITWLKMTSCQVRNISPKAAAFLGSVYYCDLTGCNFTLLHNVCHEKLHVIHMNKVQLDICSCKMHWLKHLMVMSDAIWNLVDKRCAGFNERWWSSIGLEEFMNHCYPQMQTSKTWELVHKGFLCASPVTHNLTAGSSGHCSFLCLSTIGCYSFNYHILSKDQGECYLIASGTSEGKHLRYQANSDWSYYSAEAELLGNSNM